MAKIDMSNKGKKITITTGQAPIDFSSQNKSDNLWNELTKAHERAKYYTNQMMKIEHARNNTNDKMTIQKKNLDLDHYRSCYHDSKLEVTRLENILKISR